jgi:hypothetical protein
MELYLDWDGGRSIAVDGRWYDVFCIILDGERGYWGGIVRVCGI